MPKPARKVGSPSSMSNQEEASSTTAVAAMPRAAILPAADSSGTSISAEISWRRSLRWLQRSTKYVARMESSDGSA